MTSENSQAHADPVWPAEREDITVYNYMKYASFQIDSNKIAMKIFFLIMNQLEFHGWFIKSNVNCQYNRISPSDM